LLNSDPDPRFADQDPDPDQSYEKIWKLLLLKKFQLKTLGIHFFLKIPKKEVRLPEALQPLTSFLKHEILIFLAIFRRLFWPAWIRISLLCKSPETVPVFAIYMPHISLRGLPTLRMFLEE
jgi:hypothetical protein